MSPFTKSKKCDDELIVFNGCKVYYSCLLNWLVKFDTLQIYKALKSFTVLLK